MRFLVLTQYFPPEIGAAQTRLSALARELQRCGHTVEVVTTMPSYLTNTVSEAYRGKWYVKETWNEMPIHRCWSYAATGTGLRRLWNYGSFTLSCLMGLFRAQRADILFVESPPLFLCIPAWVASRFRFGRRKMDIVFNVADLWPDSVKDLGILRDGAFLRFAQAMEAWAYQKARYVTSVTEGIRERLSQKGVPEEKVLFLPNGVDIDMFAPRPPDNELIERLQLEGKHVLLYAGTHGIAQGLETLIEAARLLHDEPFAFVFVGDGGRKAAMQDLARQQGSHNVVFVEPQPLAEMPRYFSIALASIVPLVRLDLFKSARPSKIFPSIASGTPVLYSGEGEAAELLTSANAGIVIEPESPALLAAAIRSLAADPDLRERISHNARKLAVTTFSWPAIVKNWLATIGGESGGGPRDRKNGAPVAAVSGIPFFVDAFFSETASNPGSWKHRVLRFGNRFQWFLSLIALARSDVWYTMGSVVNNRAFEAVAALTGIPRVMHWVGSDIPTARANPDILKRLHKQNTVHMAVTEEAAQELREMGFDPHVVPLPPTITVRTIPPLPEIFTVLLYVPAFRQQFYGAHIYERLIEHFKDQSIRFLIVGGGTLNIRAGAPVENLGWCSDLRGVYPRASMLLRLTERDGLSLMVLEALSHGRHVIWPHDLPFVTNVQGFSAAKDEVTRLFEKHLGGTLEPQHEASLYVRTAHDGAAFFRQVEASWTESLPCHRGRAHVPA